MKLIQGVQLNLLIKGPNWYISKHRGQTTICHFPCQMTPFWILLFIICVPKTGSTGENPADHGHYTHDAAMISRLHDAHHFWRQEHQTFSGSIKARERPQKRGRAGEAGGKSRTETKKKNKRTSGRRITQGKEERKKTKKQGAGDETGDTQTKKKKTGIIQRRRERQRSNTETSIGSAIILTEKEIPIIIQNKFTAGWPLHHLLSSKSCWESKRKRRQVNGEGRQREAVGSVATIFAVSRSRYARSSSPFYILWNLSGARTLLPSHCSCTREDASRVHPAFAQPGHWLGPVTGPGWLGLAQPTWDELGPAPQKKYMHV